MAATDAVMIFGGGAKVRIFFYFSVIMISRHQNITNGYDNLPILTSHEKWPKYLIRRES